MLIAPQRAVLAKKCFFLKFFGTSKWAANRAAELWEYAGPLAFSSRGRALPKRQRTAAVQDASRETVTPELEAVVHEGGIAGAVGR